MITARNASGLLIRVSLPALLAAYTTPAFAQDDAALEQPAEASAEVEEPGAGEIVVTAQKREESVNRVGMSITALSGESLVNLGIADAEQLVKVVPGLNYTRGAYVAAINRSRDSTRFARPITGCRYARAAESRLPLWMLRSKAAKPSWR